ncbi:MAG: glycosyltransferase family 39 protein [Oscillospiraceae bacterium]|nr:glycosyltransferase family 39 protein [Oscillospiraceae bacterium]
MKACSAAQKALDVLIALTFSAIFLVCLPSAGSAVLRCALYLGCALALVAWGGTYLSDRVLDIALALLLCAYAYLIYTAAFQLKLEPAWDFGRVYNGAKEIIINNSMAHTNNYFLESYNNFFTALYIGRFVQFAANFTSSISVLDGGIWLNIISIVLSVVLISLAARFYFGARFGLMTALCCMLSLPLISYSPVFYTDTLSLPYVSLAVLLLALLLKKERALWLKLLLGALSGACAFMAYRVKANAAFVLVAAFMVLLLSKNRKKNISFLVSAAALCALCFVFYNIWIRNTDILDYENLDEYRLPAAHFVYMGLVGSGGYNGPAHQEMQTYSGTAAKTERSLEKIESALEEYGFSGFMEHLRAKTVYTWSDGLMYSHMKLAQSEKMYTFFHNWASPYGLRFSEYQRFGQITHYLMLFCLAAGAIRAVFFKGERQELLKIALTAVFGLALLLAVWETRSRYLVNFIPLFAFCEAAFLCGISRRRDKKKG